MHYELLIQNNHHFQFLHLNLYNNLKIQSIQQHHHPLSHQINQARMAVEKLEGRVLKKKFKISTHWYKDVRAALQSPDEFNPSTMLAADGGPEDVAVELDKVGHLLDPRSRDQFVLRYGADKTGKDILEVCEIVCVKMVTKCCVECRPVTIGSLCNG